MKKTAFLFYFFILLVAWREK